MSLKLQKTSTELSQILTSTGFPCSLHDTNTKFKIIQSINYWENGTMFAFHLQNFWQNKTIILIYDATLK